MRIMKLMLCAVTAAAIAFGAAAGMAEAANTEIAQAAAAENSAFEADTETVDAAIEAMGGGDYASMAAGVRRGDQAGLYCARNIAVPMQKLLFALGKRVNADGKAGGSTFTALNEVQEALELPVEDVMNETCMNRMLLCAWCLKDPEGAKAVLGEDREAYIEAFALLIGGKNYEARLKFESCADAYADAADRAAACVKAMPENGEILRNTDGGSMNLTITLESAEEGKAALFKIYNDQGTLVSCLFLNGTGSVSTQLYGGTYSIHMGTGDEWYGTTDAFGDAESAQYQSVRFAGDSETAMMRKGANYTLYVNTADNAEAPAMTEITWAEF